MGSRSGNEEENVKTRKGKHHVHHPGEGSEGERGVVASPLLHSPPPTLRKPRQVRPDPSDPDLSLSQRVFGITPLHLFSPSFSYIILFSWQINTLVHIRTTQENKSIQNIFTDKNEMCCETYSNVK